MDKQEKVETHREKEWKKNFVKRETQVLKAIIDQTRSIGNEFLVINIKAKTEAGWCATRVVFGRISPAGRHQF